MKGLTGQCPSRIFGPEPPLFGTRVKADKVLMVRCLSSIILGASSLSAQDLCSVFTAYVTLFIFDNCRPKAGFLQVRENWKNLSGQGKSGERSGENIFFGKVRENVSGGQAHDAVFGA